MVDLTDSVINFSNFEIICSIYLKMCDEFNNTGKFLMKMGNLVNFAK